MTPEAEDTSINIQVEFTPGLAPAPAFASVCVVNRFPDYLLLDFGSIDPLMMEPIKGGQKATLQHVGRVAMPVGAARQMFQELRRVLGEGGGE